MSFSKSHLVPAGVLDSFVPPQSAASVLIPVIQDTHPQTIPGHPVWCWLTVLFTVLVPIAVQAAEVPIYQWQRVTGLQSKLLRKSIPVLDYNSNSDYGKRNRRRWGFGSSPRCMTSSIRCGSNLRLMELPGKRSVHPPSSSTIRVTSMPGMIWYRSSRRRTGNFA